MLLCLAKKYELFSKFEKPDFLVLFLKQSYKFSLRTDQVASPEFVALGSTSEAVPSRAVTAEWQVVQLFNNKGRNLQILALL